VRHGVEKLSRRTTTLVQTSSQSNSAVGSYELPKSRDSNRDNFGTPFRESREKEPFGCSLRGELQVYYKGEGGGFPQVWAVVSLVCPYCPWFVVAPKVLQLCTNHFVWVVCRPVWVSIACHLFLVPSRSSNTTLYPSKCCELGSVSQLLLLPLFPT
jgi:hypothetical protein